MRVRMCRLDLLSIYARPTAPAPQTTHPQLSPLLLCDTCPRSFHMACLGVNWGDLPVEDWCCPKCVEGMQASLGICMGMSGGCGR